MSGRLLSWSVLAIGATTSYFMDAALAGKPEQLWAPILNVVVFAWVSSIFDS